MLQSVKKYNGLNGTFKRAELEGLAIELEADEQYYLKEKILNALNANPDKSKFEITLENKAIQSAQISGLSGVEFIQESDGNGLNKSVSPEDIYKMITEKMIQEIEEASGFGYVKKWHEDAYMIPVNFVSKKTYRGINRNLLSMFGMINFKNPYFLTFKQIEKLGGKVKKGAKGREVIYFSKLFLFEQSSPDLKIGTYDAKKFISYLNKNKSKIKAMKAGKTANEIIKTSAVPLLKYYKVFNGEDVTGIDFKLDEYKTKFAKDESQRIEAADLIIKNYPQPAPILKHGGDRAFYRPSADLVQMPKISDFTTEEDYYRTLLHEYSHSTGHKDRLDRLKNAAFGSSDYAFEELIAEFGAVFLSAEAGIMWRNNSNHAEYLKNWKNALPFIKDDNKLIMRASSEAQKATDFILQPDENGVPLFIKELDKKLKKEVKKIKSTGSQTKPKSPIKKQSKPKVKVDEKGQYGLFGSYKVPENPTIKNTLDYAEKNLFNKSIYHKDIGKKIKFNKSGIKKAISGRKGATKRRLQLVYIAKSLLQSSRLIKSEKDRLNRRGIIAIHKLRAYHLINDEKTAIFFNIRETTSGTLYYDHDYIITKNRIRNTVEGKKTKSNPLGVSNAIYKDKYTKNNTIQNKGLKGVKNSLLERKQKTVSEREFFRLLPKYDDLSEFFGKVEVQQKESAIMTLSAPQGAGKTTVLFQMMNAFAESGYKCNFASLEEHPNSYLFEKKADQYLSEAAQANIVAPSYSKNNINQFLKDIKDADVIFIDSMKKLWQYLKGFDLDNDLRKAFDGKLFVIIFQLTSDGKMRGGSDAQFDGDIISFIQKEERFEDNYLYHDKNRYAIKPIHDTKYNIVNQKLVSNNAKNVELNKLKYDVC